MKIIYKGTPNSERIWEGTCNQCNSKAEATQSELKHITYDEREGGSFSWEKCPACGFGGSGYGGMLFYPKKV